MEPVISLTFSDTLATLTLNRPTKRNAFDDQMIQQFLAALEHLRQHANVRAVLLTGEGPHFSAGADLAWMQRMVNFSMEENLADAKQLDQLMDQWYHLPLPTIGLVQGAAYGGAIGLIAGCDIALASTQATFCFSEVSLGLTPAVISPYVITAIGARAARRYFLTAEVFTAQTAQTIGLVHEVLTDHATLLSRGQQLATKIANHPPQATRAAKTLLQHITSTIESTQRQFTTEQIAQLRTA
ncbi:MAG: gamma-carboxygeranoyl-CoA hydratase, partial [Legionellales bacterium]|nr:gamma-carboxygeranoyl-CoA hydratase [Legionellales bacterium]